MDGWISKRINKYIWTNGRFRGTNGRWIDGRWIDGLMVGLEGLMVGG